MGNVRQNVFLMRYICVYILIARRVNPSGVGQRNKNPNQLSAFFKARSQWPHKHRFRVYICARCRSPQPDCVPEKRQYRGCMLESALRHHPLDRERATSSTFALPKALKGRIIGR